MIERDGCRPGIDADPAGRQYITDVAPLIAGMQSALQAPIPRPGTAEQA
jgi:hypothetical protein